MNQELFFPHRSFAAIPPTYSGRESSKVVILPVPYDSTTEWRGGTRDGPRAIIDASRYLELYDVELAREIYRVGIHTLPELAPDVSGPEHMTQRVYQVARGLLDEDKVLLMLGGEHSLTLGVVRAYREKYKSLSILQLDAHADLRDIITARFELADETVDKEKVMGLFQDDFQSRCRLKADKVEFVPKGTIPDDAKSIEDLRKEIVL